MTPAAEALLFEDDGAIPNSRLPLVIRRDAVAIRDIDPATAFEDIFAQNGWTGSWRDGVFDYHHYHSTAHEVLGIAAGTVIVRFGGAQGRDVVLNPGDVAILPAGTGHRCVRREGTLLVVGAYAEGLRCDIVRAEPGKIAEARARIARVPLPKADPIDGPAGPLKTLWTIPAP